MNAKLEEMLDPNRCLGMNTTHKFTISTEQIGKLNCIIGYGKDDDVVLVTDRPINIGDGGFDYRWRFKVDLEAESFLLVGSDRRGQHDDDDDYDGYEPLEMDENMAWLNCVAFNCMVRAFNENPGILAVQRQKALIWSLRDKINTLKMLEAGIKAGKKEYGELERVVEKFGVIGECSVDLVVERP